MNLKGKSFLKLLDLTSEEIAGLLDLAADLKAKKKAGIPHKLHEGKNIVLLFEKDSTRTRCAFEVAGHDLGMGVTYLGPTGSQMGKKESIADTARVLGRMYDGIEYRGFGQEIVEDLAKYAGIPVWNGLTNEFHPTQILADFLTIREHFGDLKGKKLVYMGDARYNMGNSLMVGCAKMGMHFVACAPEKYFPDSALIAKCQEIASQTGATLEFITDPAEAVKGAHVIYTDVWVSMGEPAEVWAERIKVLGPYQASMMAFAASAQTTAEWWIEALNRSLGDRYGMNISVAMAESESLNGYYMVDGDSYYITLGVMEVYSDGKLRHEINNERKEVTIDNVDLSSVDLLTNPTHAFDFVGEEFAISVVESSAEVCVLSLVPRDDAMGVTEIRLALRRDASRVLPVSISYDYDGEIVDMELCIVDVSDANLPRWSKDGYRAYDIVSFI